LICAPVGKLPQKGRQHPAYSQATQPPLVCEYDFCAGRNNSSRIALGLFILIITRSGSITIKLPISSQILSS
jgi:hypothetical protein